MGRGGGGLILHAAGGFVVVCSMSSVVRLATPRSVSLLSLHLPHSVDRAVMVLGMDHHFSPFPRRTADPYPVTRFMIPCGVPRVGGVHSTAVLFVTTNLCKTTPFYRPEPHPSQPRKDGTQALMLPPPPTAFPWPASPLRPSAPHIHHHHIRDKRSSSSSCGVASSPYSPYGGPLPWSTAS